ncbi:hypothetical protein P3L10_027554 [Capsicum annuum]
MRAVKKHSQMASLEAHFNVSFLLLQPWVINLVGDRFSDELLLISSQRYYKSKFGTSGGDIKILVNQHIFPTTNYRNAVPAVG